MPSKSTTVIAHAEIANHDHDHGLGEDFLKKTKAEVAELSKKKNLAKDPEVPREQAELFLYKFENDGITREAVEAVLSEFLLFADGNDEEDPANGSLTSLQSCRLFEKRGDAKTHSAVLKIFQLVGEVPHLSLLMLLTIQFETSWKELHNIVDIEAYRRALASAKAAREEFRAAKAAQKEAAEAKAKAAVERQRRLSAEAKLTGVKARLAKFSRLAEDKKGTDNAAEIKAAAARRKAKREARRKKKEAEKAAEKAKEGDPEVIRQRVEAQKKAAEEEKKQKRKEERRALKAKRAAFKAKMEAKFNASAK